MHIKNQPPAALNSRLPRRDPSSSIHPLLLIALPLLACGREHIFEARIGRNHGLVCDGRRVDDERRYLPGSVAGEPTEQSRRER